MRFASVVFLALLLTGCASRAPKRSNILAAHCQPTAVTVSDLEPLGFLPAPGKVVVARIIRVSCPYCKDDLLRMGARFQNGEWSKNDVEVFLVAYRKEGIEDRSTFDSFVRDEMGTFGIPPDAVQIVYRDRDYFTLSQTRSAKNLPLFEGWKAVPFGMVFAKDGRLAYRGHFTTSTGAESEHYRFVTALQTEKCP